MSRLEECKGRKEGRLLDLDGVKCGKVSRSSGLKHRRVTFVSLYSQTGFGKSSGKHLSAHQLAPGR